MGYHYVNPSVVADPAVDLAHPEVLLYEPRHDVGRRLVAVEWFVRDVRAVGDSGGVRLSSPSRSKADRRNVDGVPDGGGSESGSCFRCASQ